MVHHEALQRVDFLLRYDELAACESPALPECVSAVRRSKIQKRLQNHGSHPASQAKEGGGSAPMQLPEVAHQEGIEDESGSEAENGPDGGEYLESGGYTTGPQDLSAEMMHQVQAERKMLSQFVRRMHDGMAMTLFDNKCNSKKVVLRLPPEHSQALLLETSTGNETIPLSCISCIHIGCRDSIFEAAGKSASMCMILTAALPTKGQSSGVLDSDSALVGEPTGKMQTYHLAFESLKDAEEFKKGMKRFRDQSFLGEANKGV